MDGKENSDLPQMPSAKTCLHGKSAHGVGLDWIGIALAMSGGRMGLEMIKMEMDGDGHGVDILQT
jgi:hypothetical protein